MVKVQKQYGGHGGKTEELSMPMSRLVRVDAQFVRRTREKFVPAKIQAAAAASNERYSSKMREESILILIPVITFFFKLYTFVYNMHVYHTTNSCSRR